MDSDNDPAFINAHLLRYCEEKKLNFSRCWPYHKNDQAYVEQKNWTAVRKLIGYDRYESQEAQEILEAIYADWERYLNFFQPIRKVVAKEKVGRKVRKRYDQAQTPNPGVLASPEVDEKEKQKLREAYETLNPVLLRRRVEENLTKLRRLHG